MANEEKPVRGYHVVGPNTGDGHLHLWGWPTEADANRFAQVLCQETGTDVHVMKVLGVWRPVERPVKFVKADDLPAHVPTARRAKRRKKSR